MLPEKRFESCFSDFKSPLWQFVMGWSGGLGIGSKRVIFGRAKMGPIGFLSYFL